MYDFKMFGLNFYNFLKLKLRLDTCGEYNVISDVLDSFKMESEFDNK